MENQELYEVPNEEQKPIEKIKITFSRKLARPFTTKAGKEYVAISIPNENAEDKSPWWEFVLPIHMVHSDHYGSKALWAEIPAEGNTTLTRSLKPSGMVCIQSSTCLYPGRMSSKVLERSYPNFSSM